MNAFTHKHIALKIYNQYEYLFPEYLNKRSFIYGNIIPDLSIELRMKSHKMKDSLEFIVERINKLTNTPYTSIKQFSIELGIINHFLADFFCTVHFHKLTKDLNDFIYHLHYEKELAKQFKIMKDNISVYILEDELNHISVDNLSEIILDFANSYSKNTPCIENDIQYMLKVTSLVSLYVMKKCFLYEYNGTYYKNKFILNQE